MVILTCITYGLPSLKLGPICDVIGLKTKLFWGIEDKNLYAVMQIDESKTDDVAQIC